jgi:hypothetical protein
MKVKKLIMKMYAAIFSGNKEQERKLYRKALLKSLKHKKTQAIK